MIKISGTIQLVWSVSPGIQPPPVSAVSQPILKMGEQAVKILIENIKNDKVAEPLKVLLPTQLEIRQSCGSFISDLLSDHKNILQSSFKPGHFIRSKIF